MEETLCDHKGERTDLRFGYRSGCYNRIMITRVDKLELHVLHDRQVRFSSQAFECYQRCTKALVSALAVMFIQGILTRKIKAATDELYFSQFSAVVFISWQTLSWRKLGNLTHTTAWLNKFYLHGIESKNANKIKPISVE